MSRILVALLIAISTASSLRADEAARQHPLVPLVQLAERRLQWLHSVRDYTCTVVKRERINGRLQNAQSMFVKLRQEQVREGRTVVPQGVYLRYLAPADVAGREVVFLQGAHDGKMIVRRGGTRLAFVTVAIAPDSPAVFQENNHPITEIGFRSMLEQLLQYAREDMNYGECEVKYYTKAKVNDRVCTVAQITHPVRRPHFQYHVAQIFIDDELQLPIRFVVYDWPQDGAGAPPLIEEFTVLDVKLNVGLTDADFDYRNETYSFSKTYKAK